MVLISDLESRRIAGCQPERRIPAPRAIRLLVALVALLLLGPILRAEIEPPTSRDKEIALQVALYLEHAHLRGQPLDDEVSGRIFDSYLEALDPLKLHFLSS
ncbi:MAG TPA: hypothetical protein VK116_08910, partial [Planctomycetota bacterium]|nr:hypothetical protein [Planctomycetota bacterium]